MAKMKVGINFGFLKLEWDIDFTNKQKENWARLLSDLEDYRVLSTSLNAEYAGEVFAAVVRLRTVTLPTAMDDLAADDALRGSYKRMRESTRDFLVSVRNIGQATLSNSNLRLDTIQPIGSQWIFVSALQRLRDVFKKEIDENCAIFKLDVPDVFKDSHRLPVNIAETWADQLASTQTLGSHVTS